MTLVVDTCIILTMLIFQYLTFVCPQDELQAALTQHGLEGWRLHTCDPVVTMGPEGSGLLNAFVVLDRYVEPEEAEVEVADDGASEGIAMTG